MALARKQIIPTERPPLVGEVSANFCVVSTTNPHSRILSFLDRSHYYFFQVELVPRNSSRDRLCLDSAVSTPGLRRQCLRLGSSSECHHSKRTASHAPQQRLPFHAAKLRGSNSSSSIVLTMLSGPPSRPTTSQKIW
jgi:hypothetical protein